MFRRCPDDNDDNRSSPTKIDAAGGQRITSEVTDFLNDHSKKNY